MDFSPKKFFDPETGKPLALFGPQHVFWVPPQVEIAQRLPIRNMGQYGYHVAHRGKDFHEPPAGWHCPSCTGTQLMRSNYSDVLVCATCYRRLDTASTVPCVISPVPATWQVELTPQEEQALRTSGWRGRIHTRRPQLSTLDDPHALRLLDWQVEHWGPRVSRIHTNELESVGWQQKTDTRGLLNAFLRLAQNEITDKVCQQVKQFVERWGPLWLCRNRRHFDCHWTYEGGALQSESPCLWAPVEEVREFVRKAWHAKVIIQATIALREGKPVPESLWPYLACLPSYTTNLSIEWFTSHKHNLPLFKRWIVDLVNEYLIPSSIPSRAGRGGPRFWMVWDDQKLNPSLLFHSGLGFISAVWVEIAQTLCKAGGFLQCSGCGDYYLRTRQRPRADQANYCETCGKEDRGSKRQYRRRQAALRAEARRLHEQDIPSAEIAQQLGVEGARVGDWTRPLGKAGRPRGAARG